MRETAVKMEELSDEDLLLSMKGSMLPVLQLLPLQQLQQISNRLYWLSILDRYLLPPFMEGGGRVRFLLLFRAGGESGGGESLESLFLFFFILFYSSPNFANPPSDVSL